VAASRYIPMSLPRRWMHEAAFFGARSCMTGGSSILHVAELAAARRKQQPLISWNAILLKGIALTARRFPELKRSYMPLPWPHFYQHPHCVAALVVERQWQGELAPFFDQIRAPEQQSLRELDRRVRELKSAEIEAIGGFRRLLRVARMPFLLRRLVFRLGLIGSGRVRSRYMGTFVLNSISSRHGYTTQATTPLSTFFYSSPRLNGEMPIQIFFDHRLMDGATAGRLLVELDSILRRELVAELNAPA
jgi:hypothetical protein